MKITAIEHQKHDPDRVSVFVDAEFRMGVSVEIAHAAHLRVGDEVTEGRLAEVERRDRGWQAREAALHLLAVRPRAAVELARRLRMKGYEPEVTDEVIERLRELGMIDDAAFAETVVRDRVRLRPSGARRLVSELRAKGVDEGVAREAIRDTLEGEGTNERELALRAAEKWRTRPGEERDRARRRLQGFLARRGFGGETIREVIDELLPAGGFD